MAAATPAGTTRTSNPATTTWGPNIHGFHRKLIEAGVPSEWAWDALFRRCPIHDDHAALCHERE